MNHDIPVEINFYQHFYERMSNVNDGRRLLLTNLLNTLQFLHKHIKKYAFKPGDLVYSDYYNETWMWVHSPVVIGAAVAAVQHQKFDLL